MREGGSTSGFTLIEALVALVIFVAGYVTVHQCISLAWRGTQVGWMESAALRVAQSRLSAAGVEASLLAGEQAGATSDGFMWTTQAERYVPPGAAEGTPKLAAYWVTVIVRWNGGVLRPANSIRLKTLKLVPGT